MLLIHSHWKILIIFIVSKDLFPLLPANKIINRIWIRKPVLFQYFWFNYIFNRLRVSIVSSYDSLLSIVELILKFLMSMSLSSSQSFNLVYVLRNANSIVVKFLAVYLRHCLQMISRTNKKLVTAKNSILKLDPLSRQVTRHWFTIIIMKGRRLLGPSRVQCQRLRQAKIT